MMNVAYPKSRLLVMLAREVLCEACSAAGLQQIKTANWQAGRRSNWSGAVKVEVES